MTNRILGLLGWLGAALVFVGAAIRFGNPAFSSPSTTSARARTSAGT
jgi:hypothetical protein